MLAYFNDLEDTHASLAKGKYDRPIFVEIGEVSTLKSEWIRPGVSAYRVTTIHDFELI
jgi:hypothetical protein